MQLIHNMGQYYSQYVVITAYPVGHAHVGIN